MTDRDKAQEIVAGLSEAQKDALLGDPNDDMPARVRALLQENQDGDV